MMPQHKVYIEPFGGAGSVLIQKKRVWSEIYNDRWDGVVNVFRVLRDPVMASELERRIRLTPFSRTEFNESQLNYFSTSDQIEKARIIIYRSFFGFGSGSCNPSYSTGFRGNGNNNNTTPAEDCKNYPDHIQLYTERLKGVMIENSSAVEVMNRNDRPDALHFLDPPYLKKTRTTNGDVYGFEMTEQDHVELSMVCKSMKGMVMICGYSSTLYDELFSDWHSQERTAMADGAKKRTEKVWANFPLGQTRLFEE